MITIWTDVPFTRRKVIHLAVDEDGAILWRERRLTALLEWLRVDGGVGYVLETERAGKWLLTRVSDDQKED